MGAIRPVVFSQFAKNSNRSVAERARLSSRVVSRFLMRSCKCVRESWFCDEQVVRHREFSPQSGRNLTSPAVSAGKSVLKAALFQTSEHKPRSTSLVIFLQPAPTPLPRNKPPLKTALSVLKAQGLTSDS